jgi:hypothetical protein
MQSKPSADDLKEKTDDEGGALSPSRQMKVFSKLEGIEMNHLNL